MMFFKNQTLLDTNKYLPFLIEHYARTTPNAPALVHQNQVYTYEQLNQKSTILAHYLQEIGLQKGDFGILHLERSFDLIIAILAIQKAGAAYVPIDINYPQDRIAFIAQDAKAKVVLTQKKYLKNIPDDTANIICLESLWSDLNNKKQARSLSVNIAPSDLAYMIYTSGSTGKPKGVLISHENVFNQLEGQQNIAPAPIKKMLLTCSISFDVSVLSIYWTFYQGATLVLPMQDEEKDMVQLANTIEEQQISHLLTLPSLLTLILNQANIAQLQSLELINVSGEVCPTSLAQKHEALLPNCQLYNLYGPTEATVNCTFFKIPKGFSEDKVPIGIPILNYDIFILDKDLSPVQQDEVGEIYIGGKEVVGKGYWNRPELSAERFIQNPFHAQKGGTTLYKTGDLGRWMPDGNIEFLGRRDFQVKFNGYRIELGEIETVIGQYTAVKEVVVLLKNKQFLNQQKLVAYLTTSEHSSLNISLLRTFLRQKLPEYMIPANFVHLDQMPLSPNGKFDRKALPEPSQERPNLAQNYQAAQGKLEEKLAQLWESLLQINPIGRNDKFFELGGDSIQAALFIGQLQKELNTSIFITTIFDYPTIAQYAQMLKKEYAEEISSYFKEIPKTTQKRNSSLKEADFQGFKNYIPSLTQFDKSEKKNPSAIFILAPPRSGTSLLSLMLGSHPDFVAFNELKLLGFHSMAARDAAYRDKFSLWQEGAIQAVMQLKKLEVNEAKALIQDFIKKDSSVKDFYRQLQAWAAPKMIIDKTPAYAMDLNTLQKIKADFDNPIFIHLVRHPFAMVPSFQKYHLDQVLYLKEHPYQAKELGELVWWQSHQNILHFLKEIPAHQQFKVLYEDLVQQPETIMQALCQQTGLNFHPNLLQPYLNIEQKGINGIHEVSRSMSDSNLLKYKSINAAKAAEWKNIKNQAFLSKISLDLTKQLGYSTNDAIEGKNGKIPHQVASKNAKSLTTNEDIAIIGMACRVPGANTLHEFWLNLVNGKDVSQTATAKDLIAAGLDPALLENAHYVPKVFSLDQPDCFDASFFGYTPREAQLMDPQHRVLLEVAYNTLESAGYNPYEYEGDIGIFGGIARNAYFTNNLATHPDLLQSAGEYADTLGSEKTFAISRVAYKLNLRGPAVNVQTACSSSGTAIHLACQSLLSNDSDMVLVAGGRIQPHLNAGYKYIEGGPLSPDGTIRAFDADAKGMVRGNGMLCILIKKLDKALADKDPIWAVIKGTAINNDGSEKIGFTAPSPKAQAITINKALNKAQLKASDIDYVEAHGTGTILGDPIEIKGLTEAFRLSTDKKQFCGIGSVKTAIGHLDAGACLAGIIKTALCLKYELLPPSLNFDRPNPQIDFENSPFYVQDTLQRWEQSNRIRRAGVSSFGLGGTNAHIILEEAPQAITEKSTKNITQPDAQLFLLSAKKETVLAQQNSQLASFLERKPSIDLKNVAYTLANGRPAFKYRKVVLNTTQHTNNQQINKIKNWSTAGESNLEYAAITFLFPGGGAQYLGMAKDLYHAYPYFKEQLDYCFDFLEKEENLSIKKYILPTAQEEESLLKKEIQQPSIALASLFSVEYALAKLWQYWGVQPNQLIGHSMGEYTAACIAGVFSVEDGLRLVTLRGRLFESLKTEGGMLSVALSEKEITPFLIPDSSISVINRADNCVISGTVAAINQLKEQFDAQAIDATRIHINVAAHSAQIDPIIPEFRAFFEKIKLKAPQIPIISNINGQWAEADAISSVQYWVNHLRQTVRFQDGLSTILEKENLLLLEVGPGQTLSNFTKLHPNKNKNHLVFSSIRHPKVPTVDTVFILKTLAKLWCLGIKIDWKNYYQNFAPHKEVLPTYPFEKKRYWIEPLAQNQMPSISDTQATPSASLNHSATNLTNTTIVNHSAPQVPLDRKKHLENIIKEILFELSGLEAEEMEANASFLELGFDSLFLTQALTKFNRKFKLAITFRQLFEDAATVETLAAYVDTQLADDLFRPVATPVNITSNQPAQATDYQNITNNNQTITTPNSNLQQIVNQQLQLMQQQLNLLKGVGQQNIAPTAISAIQNGAATEPSQNLKLSSLPKKVSSKDKGKGFGPWKPIPKGNTELTDFHKSQLREFLENYNKKTAGSKALSQAQRTYLADPRSIQAFNKLWKEGQYQIAMNRSKGSKMWDVDGNEYIDFLMSFGIGLFGHTPDFVQTAVIEQMQKGIELAALPPLAKEVAQLICEITGMERATLVNTGSEAISAAIRAARTVTGREKVAVFEGDYHGITDEMLVRGIQIKDRTKAVTIAPGIPNTAVENVLVLYYDDPNLIEVLRDNAEDLAAIIIEPLHTQTPHLQRKTVIEKVRNLSSEENIALIFDELVTGFRLTQRGAIDWYGVEPDIAAYGKIASGGLPIAMVAGKGKYLDAFDGGQWQYGDDSFPEAMVTFFGGTFVKHPLSLAAAKAVLEKIKADGPQVQYTLNRRTKAFAEKLKALFLKTKAPLAVKSAASIFAVKVIDHFPLSKIFFHLLRHKGIYMTERAGFISTAHSPADLEKAYSIFEAAIAEMFERQFFTTWEGDNLNEIIDPNLSGLGMDLNALKEVPLTPGQEEIWIGHQFSAAAAAAYNLSTQIRLEGDFDVEKMKVALQNLVKRHEALRTTFSKDGSKQIIHPYTATDISITDQLASIDADEPMDLFEGPLYRFYIIQQTPQVHLVVLTVHHIIADGWSLGILSKDLGELYAQAIGATHKHLNRPKQLSSYALEVANAKTDKAYLDAEKYWLATFENDIPVLEFPTDYSRPAIKTYDADLEKIFFPKAMKLQIQKAAAKQGCTFYNFMFAAFQVFIHRLSHQENFTMGLVAAGQAIAGNQDLVGHTVSLLPLKMEVAATNDFATHLKQVRSKMLDAFDHQNYTLGALVKKLNLTRDPSRQAIISILFNLDNEFSQFNFGNLKVSTSAIQRKYETFDIFINLKPTSEGIYFEWIYNKDLFKAASIKRKLKEFEALLKGILEQPQLPIAQLPLLSNVEKEKLLTSWNQTNVDNFSKVCIFDLFKQQAHKTPNNIALVFENQSFTYADLLKKSEGFAGYLQQKGIKRGNKVGILLNRSSEMLITLLAVLKLGATYIPLDPINPKERLQGILEDVAANYLISHAPLTQQLPDFSGEVIYYETKKSYTFPPVLANGSNPQSTDLAYIIYTSGSTGKPKGIAIPHYAVIDHHLAIIDQFKVNQQDKILALASISFDPSVQDFFMPLFVGAQITIANQETVKDGFLLKELMASQQPTLMQATPSTWQMLLLANWEGNADLKILCGGEGLSKELAKKLLPRCKEVWNIYGPTETTIWSTCKQIDATMLDDLSFSYLPIGKALNNVKVYILDQQLQPVPIGVNGEIYIAGPGVAPLGYYNRPDLNEKAFLSNPFVREEKYARLYKTGDQARYLPNGDIEYLNRGDAQVKIRGYRIELGDIEAAIGQFKGVRDNRVVVRTSQNDKRLAAYLIVEQPQDFSIDLLKNYLKNQLPTYMIPAAFVLMGAFPMTPSRKVDRNQLPAPQWLTENKKLSPPSSPTEKVLAEIWAELLDYPAIGIHDDFFALGGHSLIAIKMMARIEKQLGRKVPLASLLQHSTIQQLAKLLDKKAEDNYKGSLVPIQTKGNKAPLYLIHGGGLHVLMFQTLAAQMGEDQPIYALQARGLNGEAEPLERIEDMAAHYIQEIERFNPNQPYILAGYSFGGLIAFEMAKQLKKSNKKLLKLCVFDTVIKEELTALDHSLSEKVAIVGKKIAWNLKDLIQHPQNNLSYRKYIYQRRLNNWKHKVFNGGKNNWSNVDNQLSDLVNKSNFEAWNHYKITPYEGDLYLFKAKEQRFFIKDKHYLGWGPYVKGNIHLLDVPGDHLNLFNPPNGVVVAQILREVLEQHG